MDQERMNKAMELALKEGFTYAVPLDVATLTILQEVRDMCSGNSCGRYGKSWSCPPGCGTLDEAREKISRFKKGILVQTVGDIEDSYDFETMMEIEHKHKKYFLKAAETIREAFPDMLALGTGTCTLCASCTYPDSPCRFPEKMVSSMEAFGLLINDVCKKNDLKYYYGSDKIAYTACYLLY